MDKLCLVLLALIVLGCSCGRKISVVKYWSTVVTREKDAKLACKANTGIEMCSWTNNKQGMEFSSGTKYGRRDNEVVSVGRSRGAHEDNMCFFTINNVDEDHAGDWTCTVYGECEEEGEFDYYYDDENIFDGKKKRSIKVRRPASRLKRQTRNRRCKSENCDKEACMNKDEQELTIKVHDEDEIGVMGAQEVYFANVESEVSLTVRTNEKFAKCEIKKGRDDIVVIDGDARRDECVEMPGRSGGRVCAEVTRGVPSCILRIDSMTANMEGIWTFTIQREETSGRPRTLTESADVELVMVEMPSAVYLYQYIPDKNKFMEVKGKMVNLQAGEATLQCVADGGSPEPVMSLFVGKMNMSDMGGTRCKYQASGVSRDSSCAQYDIDITPASNKDNITCVAAMPDVDTDDGNDDGPESFVSNGKQVTVDINLSYKPQLIDPENPRENSTITICDPQLCKGDDYELVIQFSSNPAPSRAEWHMRNNDRRRKTVVREGSRRRSYDAKDIRNIHDKSFSDYYEARITLESIDIKDMSRDTEHLLELENEAGITMFKVQMNTRGSCSCDPDNKDDTENLSTQVPGEIKPFLTSCLALGTSMLENYHPDGSRRPKRGKEREFERKVEDFFEKATCAGYGREIFSNYKAVEKQEPFSTEIVFHKDDPTKDVLLKTKQANDGRKIDKDTIGIAQKIVSEGKMIEEEIYVVNKET